MNNRIWILLGLAYLLLLVYVGRLWQLQVIDYNQYATRSEGNYLRTESIAAPRGRILDRNGQVIATNRLAVDLRIDSGEILFKDRILSVLGLKEFPKLDKPFYILNIPDDKIPTLAELTAGEPNIQLVERIERVYPNPISGPVLGYTTLPTQAQIDDLSYEQDELVGVSGLEAAMEQQLRGIKGVRLVEVNARGQRIRQQELREPQAGTDIRLTIDLDLQKAAEKAALEAVNDINKVRQRNRLPTVDRARGAIVAVDPTTGEVLAMATVPSFDPNIFGRRPRPIEQIQKLFTDNFLPTINRAVQPYAPGSTYKLVTSSMVLEDGYVTPQTTFNCTPYIVFGGIRKNWSSRSWGPFTVKEAIAQSCNTWFYQAAILDPIPMVDKLAKRASELGIGRATGLEIAEQEGLVPTLKWKREVAGEPWYPGETLSIFIGQGQNQVTPVQIARMLATIVGNGRQPEFHLVRQIGSQVIMPKYTQIPGKYWQTLQEGLRMAVTWGTASTVMGNGKFPVSTGGKTGTAETGGKVMGLEHAWYMGYGPADSGDPRPPLVVVAFFERGGGGYDVALPAVKKVMAAYWNVDNILASR